MINLFNVNDHYRKNKKKYFRQIDKVLSSGKYILGENVSNFEENLKKFVGCKYSIATSNGTDALEVSLRALELGASDEVIVPSFTWISSASSIKLAGAKPVFCDIELETFGLDYLNVKRKINKKTKAIIIVSLYGQISRDIFKIKSLCKKHKIILIEDAAQSFGSKMRNINSCNIADISTTSFFPTKSLGGYGDGGAIFTNNISLNKKLRLIKQNGTLDKKNFLILGKNARLDELQAVLLIERLRDFQKVLRIKSQTAKLYTKELKNYFNFTNIKNNFPSYSLFTVRTKKRDELSIYLKKKKILTGIYYKQMLHNLKFLNNKNIKLPNTIIASQQVISLPIHESLKQSQKNFIINQIKSFFN